MFCGKCGTKIFDGDNYCTNCGAKAVLPNSFENEESLDTNEDHLEIDWDDLDEDEEKNKIYSSEKFKNRSKAKNKHDKTDDIRNAKCVIDYDNKTDPNDMDFIVTVSKEGENIQWLILEKPDDKVLLISKVVIDKTDFKTTRYLKNSWYGDGEYETNSQIDWRDSDECRYLNTDFYYSFNDKFKERILKDVPEKCYEVKDDYIFILSADEYEKYFGEINNVENKRIISRESIWDDSCDIWCLRAEYEYDDHADIITESYRRKYIFVDENNIAHIDFDHCGIKERGIRPAIWIKI